ncbi:MAG: hypothetical protein JRM72_06065 [Nitrososphaerota archaeon]|nr:hypothetical protein [Nitrososphaerota archaeon]
MNLDTSNTWVLEALNEMNQNPIFDKNISLFIFIANQMKKLDVFSDKNVQRMEFAVNLGKASQKLFSLGLLTT